MINIFACNCGNIIYSFQKLIDIQLFIPNGVREINIYELIKMFNKKKKILERKLNLIF